MGASKLEALSLVYLISSKFKESKWGQEAVFFWKTCPQAPTFTQFAQKGWQSTGLELRIPMMDLKFCGFDPEETGASPPQNIKPPQDLPPHSPIRPIYSSRRQDSEYLIFVK
jgi:hypothetical protein